MLSLALSALSLNNAPLRAGRAPTKASVSMKVEDLVGGINDPIFGGTPEGKIFDPLGLGKDEASLYRRRVVEIKHGRICMVAFLGMTVGPNDVRRRCSPASSRCGAALRPAGGLAATRRLRQLRRPTRRPTCRLSTDPPPHPPVRSSSRRRTSCSRRRRTSTSTTSRAASRRSARFRRRAGSRSSRSSACTS